jgi:hypothetical protein
MKIDARMVVTVLVHPGALGGLPDLWPEVLNDEADRA